MMKAKHFPGPPDPRLHARLNFPGARALRGVQEPEPRHALHAGAAAGLLSDLFDSREGKGIITCPDGQTVTES